MAGSESPRNRFPHGWGALSAAVPYTNRARKEEVMAGKDGSVDAVYKVVEGIGTRAEALGDAARKGVGTAGKKLGGLGIAGSVKREKEGEKGKGQAIPP